MPVETFPGAVGGFRIMKLRAQGVGAPAMLSIGRQLQGSDFEWKPNERNVMVCGKQNEHRDQRPPVWGCKCGFWFYKKMEDLQKLVTPSTYGIDEGVWCLVGGWGKIVEHEIGIRTQYARPLALIAERPPHSNPQLTDEKWLKWIGKIDLPIVAMRDIGFEAQMLEVEMLEDTTPQTIEQWITPSGLVIFVSLGRDGHTPEQPLPEGSKRLQDAWMAKHTGNKECRVRFGAEPPYQFTDVTYELHIEEFVNEQREKLYLWTAANVDMVAMMHNQAQIERMLRSPQSALYQA